MNKEYITPTAALRKLKAAHSLPQTVYIYGATGYGKTELVKQYLHRRQYTYASCTDELWTWNILKPEPQKSPEPGLSIFVADDLHLLHDEAKQQELLRLAAQENIWLILISRSPIPGWLMPLYMKHGFLVIHEDDLRLREAEVTEHLKQYGIEISQEELCYLCRESQGNAYIINHAARRIAEGANVGEKLTIEICNSFTAYLEQYVLVQWDSDLVEFLMQVSVVDEFDLPLAELITGSHYISALLDKAMMTGNFISQDNGIYRLRPILLQTLKTHAAKVYGTERMKEYSYNAALYYEIHDKMLEALRLYEVSGRENRIRELLIRNARRSPGNGHYFEMRKYYLGLKEEDIQENPILMAGMSMLYSLLMQPENSEYWYGKLKTFANTAKGGEKREAQSRLIYLDIALPHRGSTNMIEIMKGCIPLMEKGLALPEFSVTSNIPSTMNGGKDFCHWSRNDTFLAKSIGRLVERILGRYGKGLVSAALGESYYEKGRDTYEVLSLLTKAQMESEAGGRAEITFVSVGLQVRLNILHGSEQNAKAILASFEKKVKEQEILQLLPCIHALRCRIALYEGNQAEISNWMQEAPDEDKEFFILERYRYLTKIRCYLAAGDDLRAQALIEKMRYYAEKCGRTYIRMETGILSAIAKYRLGSPWEEDLLAALQEASTYKFLRLISEEGAAVNGLLQKLKKDCLADEHIDNEWFEKLLDETAAMAKRYPVYLNTFLAVPPDFCKQALEILRLQAEGLSISKIAQRLNIKPNTVKYHIKENYRKLGVSGKVDAVLAARNLGIL